MDPVTIEHRRQELQILLTRIQESPSREWNRERQRIVVLQQMVAAEVHRVPA